MSGAERGEKEKGPKKKSDCFFFFPFFYPFFPGKTWLSLFLLFAPGTMEKFASDYIALCCAPLDSLRLHVLQTCSCPSQTSVDNWRISASIPPPRRVCPILFLRESRRWRIRADGRRGNPALRPPRANAVTVSRRLSSIAAENSCCDGRGDCPARVVCVHVVADRPTWIYADSPITRARSSFVGGQSARGSRPLRLR